MNPFRPKTRYQPLRHPAPRLPMRATWRKGALRGVGLGVFLVVFGALVVVLPRPERESRDNAQRRTFADSAIEVAAVLGVLGLGCVGFLAGGWLGAIAAPIVGGMSAGALSGAAGFWGLRQEP